MYTCINIYIYIYIYILNHISSYYIIPYDIGLRAPAGPPAATAPTSSRASAGCLPAIFFIFFCLSYFLL